MKFVLRTWMVCVVAALVFGTARAASAATMYYLDVPALVEASDVVVVGKVVDSRVFIGNHDRITTEWTVDVSSTLVGAAQSRVRFRQWAGELDGQVEHVPGDGRVALDGTYVLFLRGDAPDGLFLTALAQSVYQVHPDAALSTWRQLEAMPRLFRGVLAPTRAGERPSVQVERVPLDAPVTRDFADLGFYDPESSEVSGRAVQIQLLGELLEAIAQAAEAE